ncbi:MAG TPA: ferritin-like fold-containing protein, partial [Actinopolymorphaceae bacterium]
MTAYEQDPTAQENASSAPVDPDSSSAADHPGQAGAVVPDTAPTEPSSAFDDPGYRTAVVDLLGVLAYGELTAFERLAEDAKLAPTLTDKAALATLAVTEFQHFQRLRDRLAELGDPVAAMEPFRQPVDAFHAHTAPSDWLEGLVKAYVGDGIATDFYREVAAYVDAETRALVFEVLEDSGYAEFVVDRVGR